MTLLIIPDIFGATPALARLARDLTPALDQLHQRAGIAGQHPRIFDPYGQGLWFEKENEAYDHFTRHLGIGAYAKKIEHHLKRHPEIRLVLAFSAGASAVWHLAGRGLFSDLAGAIGFYGSQIRHHPRRITGFPIHLIFPESEPHFDVTPLVAATSGQPNTTCDTAAGRHGFMNRFSINFDPGLYNDFVQDDFLTLVSRFRF